MIALDTNLLVYAHRSALPEHRAAQRAIQKAAEHRAGWAIPSPCLAEFWAVVTHPASPGRPSRPEEARAFVAGLRDAGAKVLYPREGSWERLASFASGLGVHGPRIFDLQVALTCRDSNASELWTHDRNFISVPGLPIVDPL